MSIPEAYTDDGTPTLNDVFRCLSHPTRRKILLVLVEDDAREFTPPELTSSGSATDEFDVQLYQRHLPLLDAMELIEWDVTRGTVTPGTQFDAVEPLLELLDTHQEQLPWEIP